MTSSAVEFLGQGGFRISWYERTIYLDPYLSHSVELLDSADMIRQTRIPIDPDRVDDASWVVITHEHLDHCDPHTLPQIAAASPAARFLGPSGVLARLQEWGIPHARLHLAPEGEWLELLPDLRVRAVPAAHPKVERNSDGGLLNVGYVFEELGGAKAYFAGDTSADEEVINRVMALGQAGMACVPVNEVNYFRSRRGIVGNMSVREAFLLAQELGVRRVFPCHWDMFHENSAYPEEIRLIYDKMSPEFRLESSPFPLFEGA